jgi:hypothetical protein
MSEEDYPMVASSAGMMSVLVGVGLFAAVGSVRLYTHGDGGFPCIRIPATSLQSDGSLLAGAYRISSLLSPLHHPFTLQQHGSATQHQV